MRSCSTLTIILLTVFLGSSPGVFAQCSQRIATKDVKIDKNGSSGSFKLEVSSSSGYRGEVIQLDGINQTSVETFTGAGNREFSFSKLEIGKDLRYRAVIEFNGEDGILCRKKYIDVDFKPGIN